MSMSIQYKQYLNVRKAFLLPEYRGLETKDNELSLDEFSKTFGHQRYILLKCIYPQNFRKNEYRGRSVFVVLTKSDGEFHNRSKELVYLMDKLSGTPEAKTGDKIDLFLITSEPLKKRTIKKMKDYSQFNYVNVPLVRFAVEIPKANLCNKHEIATDLEIKKLAQECYNQTDKNKYMSEDNPQNVWIGGLPGELIKITRYSMMAGISIDYRYITGLIIQVNENEGDDEEEEEPEEKKED